MENHGKITQEQLEEFIESMATAFSGLTGPVMRELFGNEEVLREKLRGIFVLGGTEETDWRQEWTRFYREVFRLAVDLSGVVLPAEAEDFIWLVVLAKELGDKPLNKAFAACRKWFSGSVGTYTNDLDVTFSVNDRDPKSGSYAIRVRARVEADEENVNLSANDIYERELVTMTVLERMVLELFYFWKTGKHLDLQNYTLCSGTRGGDGHVPRCNSYDANDHSRRNSWRSDVFEVHWGDAKSAFKFLRAREVKTV